MPYILVVLPAARLPGRRHTAGFTILASVLTVLAYPRSPEPSTTWQALDNRVLALAVIWITAVLAMRQKATQERELAAERRAQELQNQLVHVTRLSTMGEMASGIAHELNQPLGAITNYSNVCLRMIANGGEDRARLTGSLDKINDEARRASDVIQRLDAMVRRRNERVVISDCNNRLREALKLIDTEVRAHGTAFQVDPGIDPEKAAELWEPFVTGKSESLGMGLAISRTVVQTHGGSLTFEPNADRGITFNLWLPATRAVGSR